MGPRGLDYVARTQNSTTSVSFPVYDGHGNMTATLSRGANNSFTVGNQRSYDVWGSVRSGSQTGDPKGRYCANLGHKQDDESGLIYMRARYYEPGSGRFVSEDPAEQGKNWYEYACNMGNALIDQSGKGGGSEGGSALTLFSGGPLGDLIGVFLPILYCIYKIDSFAAAHPYDEDPGKCITAMIGIALINTCAAIAIAALCVACVGAPLIVAAVFVVAIVALSWAVFEVDDSLTEGDNLSTGTAQGDD